MVKVLTKTQPHTDGSIVFNRLRQCAPNLMLSWTTRVYISNDISISSAVFAQLMAESPYTLQWAAPFPRRPLCMGVPRTPSNACFLGPTRVHNPNGISISSVVFAGFLIVRDRQTDQQTDDTPQLVTTGCSFVRSTATRPNNRYILNAVTRCPYLTYVRNAGRGQLSSEWCHNENDIIMRTRAASAVGTRRAN